MIFVLLLNCILFFSAVMKLYRNQLTLFEQAEVLDYPEIWYLGLEAKKIEGVPGAPMNNGKRNLIEFDNFNFMFGLGNELMFYI